MTATHAGIHVSHLDQNGSWLVELEGEHDIATIPLLQQQTREIWPHCTLAVIDLSATTFIDCSVVGWLAHRRDALNESTSAARPLRIVEGRTAPTVQRVFDVLRLREAFDCYATRNAALAETIGSPQATRRSIDRSLFRHLPHAVARVSRWTSAAERHER